MHCSPLVHAFVCSRLRFLQQCIVWSALVPARSSTVDPKRRCSTHPPDPQVQLHLIGDSWWAALASCSIPDCLQTVPPCPKLFGRLSSILSHWALYSGLLGYWSSSKFALGFPRYPCGTKGQDRTIRSAGFLRFGPSPMELTAAKNSLSHRKARSL